MGWMDGEGLVNAMKTKEIKLKKKESKIKEREIRRSPREESSEELRGNRERSYATFEGIDQSCIVARKKFVQ